MEKKYTFCRICEAFCGYVAEVENNRIIKYYPDKEHPVSKGYACIKGINFPKRHYHLKRVKYPLKRNGRGFERISWEQAIDEIGGRLVQLKDTFGPAALAAYFGNPYGFSYSMGMFGRMFMGGIGTQNLYGCGSQDCNNKLTHSLRFYGSPLTIIVPDFDRIDYLLALGANPLASQFSFGVCPNVRKRFQKMEQRGCRMVWINPRKTESAHTFGEHYYIRPNTDITLLMGMIHYILENNLEDKTFIQAHSQGIGRLRQIAREHGEDLDRIEGITGVPKDRIIQITQEFVQASHGNGASIYGRVGADRGPFATLVAWAKDVLNFITGNIDKKGNFFTPPLFKLPAPKHTPKKSRVGNFDPVLGSYPAATMADEILTPGEGQIRAMIIMAGDPLVTCANSKRLEKAFSSLDLLVSMDCFVNDTGCLAHYVLPCTTFLEREDFSMLFTSMNPIPFSHYTSAIVEPEHEEKPEWEIFQLLGKRMGIPMPEAHPKDIFPSALSETDRKTYQSLVSSEKGIFITEDHKLKYNTLFPDHILFPDHRIPLVPDDYGPEFHKLENWKWDQDQNFPFQLVSGRQKETINSWIHERLNTNHCYINMADARRLGISENDEVNVSTKIGTIRIPAKLTEDLMEGAVWIPHGWGRTVMDVPDEAVEKKGVNVNLITDDDWTKLERIAGMVMLDGIPVKVEKV